MLVWSVERQTRCGRRNFLDSQIRSRGIHQGYKTDRTVVLIDINVVQTRIFGHAQDGRVDFKAHMALHLFRVFPGLPDPSVNLETHDGHLITDETGLVSCSRPILLVDDLVADIERVTGGKVGSLYKGKYHRWTRKIREELTRSREQGQWQNPLIGNIINESQLFVWLSFQNFFRFCAVTTG